MGAKMIKIYSKRCTSSLKFDYPLNETIDEEPQFELMI